MSARGPCWALLGLLLAAGARAACPPHELMLQVVRAGTRVQIEQLEGGDTRIETPFAHVPGRTLGYEVEGLFRVTGPVAEALQRTFGRRDSYACEPGTPRAQFEPGAELPIGMLFASRGGAVAVVLHLPSGEAEVQLEGSARAPVPLSRLGQQRWDAAMRLLAAETHTSPGEFYQQMRPSVRVPMPAAPGAAPDSSGTPRDGADSPR